MTSNPTLVLDTNAVVSAVLLPRSITRQAFDHAFATGGATCIVSGDRDLLDLAPYQGIDILSPSDFLQAY